MKENNLDYKKCIANIRYLLKERGVGLGQIEESAGYSRGYLCRLEKTSSMPSVKFLNACSKELKVTIDTLINGDVSTFEGDIQYKFDFVHALITKTENDFLDWKKNTDNTDIVYSAILSGNSLLNLRVKKRGDSSEFGFYIRQDADSVEELFILENDVDSSLYRMILILIEAIEKKKSMYFMRTIKEFMDSPVEGESKKEPNYA